MPPKRARTAAAKPAATAASTARVIGKTTRAAVAKDAGAEKTQATPEKMAKNATRRDTRRAAQREEETVIASEETQDAGAEVDKAGSEAQEEAQVDPPKATSARTRGRPRKKAVQNAEDRKATEALKRRMLQEEEARRARDGEEVVKDTQPENEDEDEDDDEMVPESQPVNAARDTSTHSNSREMETSLENAANNSNKHELQDYQMQLLLLDQQNRKGRDLRKARREQEEEAQASRSPTPPAPATVARPQPRSALKVQSTPGADKSVLALANFRRRARQPSILQMMQRADEEGGEDETENTTALTLDDSDEESDEDSFAPEHEGTPMLGQRHAVIPGSNPKKNATTESVSPRPDLGPEPGAREEDEEEDELYRITPPPPPSNPRKRKSDAMSGGSSIQVPRSSPSRPRSHSPDLPSHTQDPDNTIPATNPETSPSHDEVEELPQSPASSRVPAPGSTFAEPLSSSPPASPAPGSASRPNPLPVKGGTATRGKKQKPLDTATLRSLLPKRRAPQRGVGLGGRGSGFDVPTSSDADADAGLDEDEDELAPRRRGAGKGGKKGATPKKAVRGKGKGALSPSTAKKSTIAAKTPKAKEKEKNAASARISHPTRTYSRVSDVSASNKENEEDDDGESSGLSELESDTGDTSVETVAPKKAATGGGTGGSRELQEAKERFKEVDQWEMEFESCSFTQGSSPWR